MSSVLERRRLLLNHMRELTLENGHFTVTDIAGRTGIPRSTVQDWIYRLVEERCILQKEEKRGRAPARYVTSNTMLSSSCRRIFTTIDRDVVCIYHECRSSGCAAFCAYHHMLAGGVLSKVIRDGTLLIEYSEVGEKNAEIGLYPSPAVGVTGVRVEGKNIVQTILCIGGPAYSLTDMMTMAEGVCDVRTKKKGNLVEGEVVTQARTHLVIGIDDTDNSEGGATFALALGLLQYLEKLKGVIPIGHHVVMLNPGHIERTAGNSCSFIELAVEPQLVSHITDLSTRFVSEESLSPDWGIAVKQGFLIADELKLFGKKARESVITVKQAKETAINNNVYLTGGRGRIGALAAVSFRGLSNDEMLNPGHSAI